MTIVEQKKKMRMKMLPQRARLDKQKKAVYDQWICQSLLEIIHERGIKTVHCYLPMGTEINITPLIERMLSENITIITPKTLPKPKLQNLMLHSLDELEKGVFGTSHPANSTEFTGQYDLIIVPGLAFDKANFRLGYGGGYYDTFLAQSPDALKIGIGYPFQIVDQVPLEDHDIRLTNLLINEDFSVLK